jgi:prophage regulatory protein
MDNTTPAGQTAPLKPKKSQPRRQPLEVATLPHALLKISTVSAITSLSEAAVFRMVGEGRFPQPVRLGKRCTRWKAGEVMAWLALLDAATCHGALTTDRL